MRIFLAALCFWLFPATGSFAADPAVYGYRVLNVYPHDTNAFTQGLLFRDGGLYESTGLRGESSIRKVNLTTGEVTRRHDLPDRYFGEGIVDWGDRLISVTWRSGRGFIFEIDSLDELGSFLIQGEGWGLTRDDSQIIMSDGTDVLRFLDPKTFGETGRVSVSLRGRSVRNLNELEWVDGELFANVWQTDWILRIDPRSGVVTGIIDLSGLLPDADRTPGHTDVLNGIAYDAESKRLFVTGKRWPKLFEIELVEKTTRD